MQEFIEEIREQIDLNNILNEWDFHEKSFKSHPTRASTSIIKKTSAIKISDSINTRSTRKRKSKYFITRFSSYIQAKLKKEDKCFKCLKKGHRSSDDDVLCKNKKFVTHSKVVIKLHVLNIE